MNKKLIYSLCATAFLATSCDYNEDNFPGFDDNPVTDVIYYEGEFTGKYPAEGFFQLVKDSEDKSTIEKALVSMLDATYPYCDNGSKARVTLKVATVIPPYEKEPDASIAYKLAKEDYDTMGEEAGQPGKYDNFDSKMNIDNYLKDFCLTKYASEAVGTIVKIGYVYYSGSAKDEYRFYVKSSATSWKRQYNVFEADREYSMTAVDYQTVYADTEATRFETTSYDEVNALMSVFLKNKFAYLAADGMTVSVSYIMISNKGGNYSTSSVYRYDALTGEWSYYKTSANLVLEPTDRIAVLEYKDGAWKMTKFISSLVKLTCAADEYKILYNWVKVNKSAFLRDGSSVEEYYFGVNTTYNNINNKYATWRQYYNVDNYLDQYKTDAEVQAMMDERLATDGIAALILPSLVTKPSADNVYEVVYKIYGGRGDGDYSMSFDFDATSGKFVWDGSSPVNK